MSLPLIYDLASAQASILRREAPDAVTVPEGLLAGIQARFGEALTPEEAVRKLLNAVRQGGDAALRAWTAKIDGVTLKDFAFSPSDLQAGYEATPAPVREALSLAAERIRAFHARQPKLSWVDSTPDGTLGQLVRPLERVGVYVPGGTAPLPSTLLMSVIPAQVAGVDEIVVCTPSASPVILAAAQIIGVEKVYRLGGALAIAALAYGTESLPRVDKIVGPGNLFVTIAKRLVYGTVGIDGLLGPTETLLIADDSANPAWVAADMMAQAEHDVLASAITLTPSRALAEAVQAEIARQWAQLGRNEVIETALTRRGGLVLVDDLEQALAVANAYAPEHLCLLIENAADWVGKVRHAGGVFVGEHSFEVLGDYIAGPSHAMPTGGTARFSSPLNVWDFVKIISWVGLNAPAARRLSAPAALLAQAESLDAHAAAAQARTEG
jgi:histidinol dehydrogenase